MAKIIVPATFLMARVQKTRTDAAYTHGIMTLKAPNLYTKRLGMTRPTALAAFNIAICKMMLRRRPSTVGKAR